MKTTCVQRLILYVHKNSSYHHEYVTGRMEEANSSIQNKIKDNNHTDKKNLHLTSHNNEVPAIQEEALFTCSLYISRVGSQDQGYTIQGATCNLFQR